MTLPALEEVCPMDSSSIAKNKNLSKSGETGRYDPHLQLLTKDLVGRKISLAIGYFNV